MTEIIETEEERKRRLKREKMQRYRANRAARDAQGIAPDQEFAAYARRANRGKSSAPGRAEKLTRAARVNKTIDTQEQAEGSIWPLVAILGAVLAAPIAAGLAMHRYRR